LLIVRLKRMGIVRIRASMILPVFLFMLNVVFIITMVAAWKLSPLSVRVFWVLMCLASLLYSAYYTQTYVKIQQILIGRSSVTFAEGTTPAQLKKDNVIEVTFSEVEEIIFTNANEFTEASLMSNELDQRKEAIAMYNGGIRGIAVALVAKKIPMCILKKKSGQTHILSLENYNNSKVEALFEELSQRDVRVTKGFNIITS